MTDSQQKTDEACANIETCDEATEVKDRHRIVEGLCVRPIAVAITTGTADIIDDILDKLYDDYYRIDAAWLTSDEVSIQTLILYEHFDPSAHHTKTEFQNLASKLHEHCGYFGTVSVVNDFFPPTAEQQEIPRKDAQQEN